MVFSSHLFIFYFLPLALLFYYLTPNKGKALLLTLASYFFYGWANPFFVFLMLGSTAIDYICGRVIAANAGRDEDGEYRLLPENTGRSKAQRWAVAVSIISNLSLLGFFKYFNFGIDSWNMLAEQTGLSGLGLDLGFRVTLPLGISFYTFQSMSYSIDVYRGHARAIRNIIDFSCYVSLFPQLVAGPIIRFSEVAEQLRKRAHTFEKVARGCAFFCLGLCKKVMLANPCGKVADTVFDAHAATVLDAWYGVVAYAFQIYFDFSAYSDMAIGLGLMLGFVFPKNFDSPYRSQSITEFWRRWHISLSSWLRDYLYLPLGGNRKGTRRTYINLMLVMLLGGLWHGAAWNFLIWGLIHGAWLALERVMGKKSFYATMPRILRVSLTFFIVCVSWVFFRAASLPEAWTYCLQLFGLRDLPATASLLNGLIYQPYYVGTFLLSAVIVWFAPQTWDWTRKLTQTKVAIMLLLFVLSILLLTAQAYNPFIYFIF